MKNHRFFSALAVLIMSFAFKAGAAQEIVLGEIGLSSSLQFEDLVLNRVCSLASLRLQVDGGGAEIQHLNVVFGNGESQVLSVRKNFQAGEASRWIDLDWTQRCVTRIQVVGRSNSDSFGTRIRFQARQYERPLQMLPLGYSILSSQSEANLVLLPQICGLVNLKLVFSQGAVDITRLTVRYGNGTSEDIPVRQHFEQGTETRWINFSGGARCLEMITLKGRPGGDGFTPSRIEFLGLIER